MALRLTSPIPDDAVVLVSYVQPSKTADQLRGTGPNNVAVESFTWDVTANRQIPLPPEQAVYLALGRYFSGSGSLRSTVTFVDTYFEDLLEKVDAGELSALFNIDQDEEQRSAWGTDGTEEWGWGGEGFPKRVCYEVRPGETRCIEDTGETWGWGSQHRCGDRPQPGFHDNDYGNFFWACTSDGPNGQWVPVKRHRPGVDYSHDSDLVPSVRPSPQHDAGRNDPDGDDPDVPNNQKCLFRDEEGNLAPLFRADFHPQDHPNPQLRGKPVRVNGEVQGTTIHGRNWDPIAQVCRGS